MLGGGESGVPVRVLFSRITPPKSPPVSARGRKISSLGRSRTRSLKSGRAESNGPFILVSQNAVNKECWEFWFLEYAKCPSAILNHISVRVLGFFTVVHDI